ncbi:MULTISPECIES: amino acid permease [Staphylococcus]|uniref:amino acid permease n=1 Tax=Staphylococcus TaxID=1279 RepID=UPI000619A01C|nr:MULTISPECIES: amino acid permease [Staphylococcus]KKD21999.1 gamma-aminobutyrate permease [Staphylococcus cohnii subsp. cohnii]PTF44871.1 amino acid permease [Staphylococcus cohnii]KKD25014.1 gamma-aminobutyrate permease [Staphylococcus cohnii subsp. cohnii]MDK7752141.1 amino acid permease [Staphylococcus sp. UMB10092B]MDQ7110298.1 amino acid permease [Staphylococcus ureilyticus]
MAQNNMNRGLNSRHISMIAIGGAIGTGLFVATGSVISQAGPGGAILAYLIIGVMLYFLMSSIGELATFYPVSGSFSSYSTRFVDSSLGFTMGWLYWAIWLLVTSVDIIISSSVIYYWDFFQFFSPVTWSIIFLAILFLLNIFSVKAFGETEFWLSLIKVATIIIFIVIGVLTIIGILGGKTYGLGNYVTGEAPFVGGISGFLGVLLVAGFSVGGTEVVAVTAGESSNPSQSMPKAIKQVFWRILLFYVLSIAVISAIIPYTDPLLLNKSESVSQSPFTIVFDRVGIAFAASVINAVILTSLLSAANSGIYTTSRMLFSMAEDKQAPRFLSKLNKTTKLPLVSLFVTFMIVLLIIIIAQFKSDIVFSLLNIIGSLVIVVWASSIVAQIRLRSAIKKQNKNPDEVLPYKAPFYPLGPIIVIIALLFLFIGNSIGAILAGDISVLIRNLSPMIILAIIYFVHKLLRQTKIVKLEDIDLKEHDYN